MDSLNSSPGQEKEGGQQPSESLVLSDREKSMEKSLETPDYIPLSPSLLRHDKEIKHTLAIEPFQPIIKVLADFERDDLKFAFPAARLVGLYRRL
ncbi:unnamed protein product [Penicillium roqueforti FM164]|uniref:Uncharacterized protein n=1 Tax=Penicillium roqueforti (strain FM164) TaxID=1365484 RepID=W6QVP5_PENRF|nr:unnamed protein product [Penicillium roqueforti FM164]